MSTKTDKILETLTPLTQAIFLSAVIVCWQIFFRIEEVADVYFVINIGRYILENGFPQVDPFTIHENLKLVPQQWLSGIFFWEVYKFLGADGIKLLDCIFGSILLVIYWRLCLFVSGGNKFLSLALSFVVGMFIASMILPRPQIFSTLLLLLEVFSLEKFTRTKDFRYLLPLPLLSVLLVNCHAAIWLMSLVMCLPFLFVKDTRHIKFLLAAMAAIFLCGLINPYGLDAMTYVFRSYGVDLISQGVKEMSTPTAHKLYGKIFYLSEALIIFSLAKFKVAWRYVLLSVGITFMAIMHERNLILFYFFATLPLAYVWKNFSVEKFLPAKDAGYKNFGVLVLMFFLLLLLNTVATIAILRDGLEKFSAPLEVLFFISILFLLYNLLIVKFEGRVIHPAILPRKNLSLFVAALIIGGIALTTLDADKKESDEAFTAAIKFLIKNERPENISLYVDQGYGGLAGMFGVKYYIDSRSEVFIAANNKQKNILAEYVNFKNGKIYYKDFFARYKFTHIIFASDDYFLYRELTADKNFRVIYESERVEDYKVIRCKIFVPKNGA